VAGVTAPVDELTEVPDFVPEVCWVAAGGHTHICPDRFAEWDVVPRNAHPTLAPKCWLCTPCKERWQSYGNIVRAVRL
jgi:hypothetical protein